MRGTRRSARLVTASAVAWLALAACGLDPAPSSGGSPSTPAPRHFDGEALSFDYPGAWSDATFDVVSSFSSVIVYLSTSPLSDPCERTPGSITCDRNAVAALGADGVLVEWSRQSFPGWTFDPTKGRLTTVGGQAATLEQVAPSEGGCGSIGGERELVVTIGDVPPNWNWTEMRACLRGPSLDRLQAQVEAMLGTVTWKP